MVGLNSQQEYSKLENGKLFFTDDIIQNICESFNISLEEFLSNSPQTNIANSPNTFNHSKNNYINDKDFIDSLIKAKDETIKSLKDQIELFNRILEK